MLFYVHSMRNWAYFSPIHMTELNPDRTLARILLPIPGCPQAIAIGAPGDSLWRSAPRYRLPGCRWQCRKQQRPGGRPGRYLGAAVLLNGR